MFIGGDGFAHRMAVGEAGDRGDSPALCYDCSRHRPSAIVACLRGLRYTSAW